MVLYRQGTGDPYFVWIHLTLVWDRKDGRKWCDKTGLA